MVVFWLLQRVLFYLICHKGFYIGHGAYCRAQDLSSLSGKVDVGIFEYRFSSLVNLFTDASS